MRGPHAPGSTQTPPGRRFSLYLTLNQQKGGFDKLLTSPRIFTTRQAAQRSGKENLPSRLSTPDSAPVTPSSTDAHTPPSRERGAMN